MFLPLNHLKKITCISLSLSLKSRLNLNKNNWLVFTFSLLSFNYLLCKNPQSSMHFRSHLQKKISLVPQPYKSSLIYPSFYFFLPLILLFQIFFAFRFLLYQKISYQIGKLSKKNLISKKSSSQISNIFFHVQSTHSKCTWHSSGSLLLAWPGKS